MSAVRFDLGKKMRRMRARFRGERASAAAAAALCAKRRKLMGGRYIRDRPAGKLAVASSSSSVSFAADCSIRAANRDTTRGRR